MEFASQDKNLAPVTSLISNEFELATLPTLTAEEVIDLLTAKVAYMIDHNTDELFSKLYRLDVFESKIKAALQAGGDIPRKIATLIFERQMEKVASRKQNPAPKPDDDLAW